MGCLSSDHPDVEGAACPACGATRDVPDPFIGRVIADRYEIRQWLATGGMARVYRAVQRSLDRSVVVKVVDPALLAADEAVAGEAVNRFMVEAHAASRLNHPNVVSVIDFGRTAPADGGHLFLVMEYLSGSDLWTLLAEPEPLPIARVVSIVRQVLAALGEAHHLGVAHRDIKPENVVVESLRGGRDLVKVIDFGIAKLGAMQALTKAGQVLGTPHYMAPEQVEGRGAAAGADLYSVGVLLFRMLTGKVPFDGETLVDIMRQHAEAPRPDPRAAAPSRGISDALAEVCLRAMDVDPARRFADADAFARALAEAGEPPGDIEVAQTGRASWAPPRPSLAPEAPSGRSAYGSIPDAAPRPRTSSMPPPRPGAARASLPPPPRVPAARRAFVGRGPDLVWAREQLDDPGAEPCVLLWGRAGIGRTRLLGEVAAALEAEGAFVARAQAAPPPLSEVGYVGLRRMITRLTRLAPTTPELASGAAANDPSARRGLRAIFAAGATGEDDPDASRRAARAALHWALSRALDTAGGGPVVLAIDDAHRLDGASREALVDALNERPSPSVRVLASSEQAPERLGIARVVARRLEGLAPQHVAQLWQLLGGRPGAPSGGPWEGGDVEPLAVELAHRWAADPGLRMAAGLEALVESKVAGLPRAQRRTLQAVAVAGVASVATLADLVPREDVGLALARLREDTLVAVADGTAAPAHELFGRTAVATTPAAAIGELHASLAAKVTGEPGRGELAVYHALRGTPDFQTFLMAEQAARLRALRGDDDGAIALLWQGVRAARTLLQRGEIETGASACVVFACKLATVLVGTDRVTEAVGVLDECLDAAVSEDGERARVLELYAAAERRRGDVPAAKRRLHEGLAAARRAGDTALVQRLGAALAR